MKIKEKEAVSPVIGVILMVAITVVLAAVLYVWVSGFMGGGGAMTPVGALATPALGAGGCHYNITVNSVSPATDPAKIKWYVLDSAKITKFSGTLSEGTALPAIPASGVNVLYRDNDGNDKLSTADVIQIGFNSSAAANNRVATGDWFRLGYIDTGGTIAETIFP
ncbi:MAG: archaellin/type IV pilin N-terminal domain-containing protein [Candidatus Thermoplasmatota archaeon]